MNWIHINDGMPEAGKPVIIWTVEGAFFYGWYVKEVNQWNYFAPDPRNINVDRAPFWMIPTPPDELKVDGEFIDVINAAVKK